MSTVGQALISSEDRRYGVPDWLTLPLVWAESSFQSDAQNGPYKGLLAIGPTYPGVGPGTNLFDPKTNLDIGLPPLAAALGTWKRAHPGADVSQPNNAAYDFVLTHSGHPTFTGAWNVPGQASQQPRFEQGYKLYAGPSTGVDPGRIAGQAGSAVGGAVGGAVSSVTDIPGAIAGIPGGLQSAATGLMKWALPHLVLVGGAALCLVLILRELGQGMPVPVPV